MEVGETYDVKMMSEITGRGGKELITVIRCMKEAGYIRPVGRNSDGTKKWKYVREVNV